MRYYLDHDQHRPERVIYVAAEQQQANGTVVLTLPDSLPREDAEKARRALGGQWE